MFTEKDIKQEKAKYEKRLGNRKRKRFFHLTLILIEVEILYFFVLEYFFLILLIPLIYLGIKQIMKIHKEIKLLILTIKFLEVAIDPKKVDTIPEEIRNSFRD